MQAEDELALCAADRPTVLTIGVFDGVHLGHQFLINETIKRAKTRGLLSGVVTFHPHPASILSERFQPKYISSLPERLAAIKALGVDIVAPLTFTPELSRLSAGEFVALLTRQLKLRELVVGPDFALGRNRQGDLPTLAAIGNVQGFDLVVVPPLVQHGETVSSTAIRRALADGEVGKAARLLGRPVTLSGEVVEGDRRGRTIGFPTANVAYEPDRALPADGVYATRAHLHGLAYEAVTNIGVRPTFNGRQRTIEVFLLDFRGDIYHELLTIELIKRLRGEQRFGGIDDLKAQIARDVEGARLALRNDEEHAPRPTTAPFA